jgi:hypothetical protein
MNGKSFRMCMGMGLMTLLGSGCSIDSPAAPEPALASTSAGTAAQPSGSPPPFVFPEGCCYYDGGVVRTVVPPARTPQEGRDNFYGITNGLASQKGVVAVAPGDSGYHGGHWKFFSVTFVVAPYLLTSEAAVLAAEAAGDVTITRVRANDFRCPIQP